MKKLLYWITYALATVNFPFAVVWCITFWTGFDPALLYSSFPFALIVVLFYVGMFFYAVTSKR